MHFKLALAAALAAGSASAASVFGVVTTNSPGPLLYKAWSVARNNILVDLPSNGQNASCDAGFQTNYSTFRLNDDTSLSLYSTDNPPQQLYVDRSGMGMGKIGFTTGAQPPPRNAERTGWAVDANGRLTLAGNGFVACPGSADGSWAIWLAVVQNPGHNPDCVSIGTRVVPNDNPVSCYYAEN